MNIEPVFTVLRREQLLVDHASHSVQFEHLAKRLLCAFSTAAVIPPLTAEEIQLYAALVLLHDVGKRAIPQEILNKPGQLTQEEFSIMNSHTTQGCDLLEKIPELRECEMFPLICDVCLHHHKRWNGNDYLDRLAGFTVGDPPLACPMAVVYKKKGFLSPAARAFIDQTKEFYARFDQGRGA